jgi:hypothetical protein
MRRATPEDCAADLRSRADAISIIERDRDKCEWGSMECQDPAGSTNVTNGSAEVGTVPKNCPRNSVPHPSHLDGCLAYSPTSTTGAVTCVRRERPVCRLQGGGRRFEACSAHHVETTDGKRVTGTVEEPRRPQVCEKSVLSAARHARRGTVLKSEPFAAIRAPPAYPSAPRFAGGHRRWPGLMSRRDTCRWLGGSGTEGAFGGGLVRPVRRLCPGPAFRGCSGQEVLAPHAA